MCNVQEKPWLALRQFAQGEQVRKVREHVPRKELARKGYVDRQCSGKRPGSVLVTGGIAQIIQRFVDSGRKPAPYGFCLLYLFLHCSNANFKALSLTVEYLREAVGTCQHYQSSIRATHFLIQNTLITTSNRGGISLAFSK